MFREPDFESSAQSTIFDFFLRDNKVFEAIESIANKKLKITYTSLENLLRASNVPESNYPISKVLEFFSSAERRKLVAGGVENFDQILNSLIKEKEFLEALSDK